MRDNEQRQARSTDGQASPVPRTPRRSLFLAKLSRPARPRRHCWRIIGEAHEKGDNEKKNSFAGGFFVPRIITRGVIGCMSFVASLGVLLSGRKSPSVEAFRGLCMAQHAAWSQGPPEQLIAQHAAVAPWRRGLWANAGSERNHVAAGDDVPPTDSETPPHGPAPYR